MLVYYLQKEPEASYTFTPDADFPVINVEKGGLNGTITAEFPASEALPRIKVLEAGVKLNVVPDRCHLEIEGMRKGVAEIYCAAAKDQTGVSFTITELDENTIAIDAQGAGSSCGASPGWQQRHYRDAAPGGVHASGAMPAV